jgi:hypothetical protein
VGARAVGLAATGGVDHEGVGIFLREPDRRRGRGIG